MVFREPHVAQRGPQPLSNDAAVPQPHFVHARVAIRPDPVPDAIDDKHSHAGYCQVALLRPFGDEVRRDQGQRRELPPLSRCEYASKRDERLARPAFRNGRGTTSRLESFHNPENRESLSWESRRLS